MLCGPVEKYQLNGCAFLNKRSAWAGYLSINNKSAVYKWRVAHIPTLCVSPFVCRAGYLTLFGGEQNNNGTDPSSVYEEYKKFDGLLTKMARGTLKPGNHAEDTSRHKLLQKFDIVHC